MERYATHKPKIHPSIQLESSFPSFSTIIHLLHTPHLHYTYYVVLYSVLMSNAHLTAYESILRCALHLILMTLDNRIDYEEYHRVTENTHEYNTAGKKFPAIFVIVRFGCKCKTKT
jgi:predicted transposase YdaD